MSAWGGTLQQLEPGEGIEAWELLDLLTGLVDKNLVVYDEKADRYHLLETVRAYGRALLNDQQEADTWRVQHLQQYPTLAEEADKHLEGPEQAEWLERLDTEYDNLRAALRTAVEGEEEE